MEVMFMNVKQLSLLFTLFISITLCINIVENKQVNAFTDQVIQHGAVGEDVIELQARLKHIGFFTGEIDGVFGWRTYWALRHFQYEFGMDIDCMSGATTKDMLTRVTEYCAQKV